MLEGAKHKYNRKGEAQKLQTGKPIWPINVFCLTLPLHDVEKKFFFLTERFHVKIFSASLQSIRRLGNIGLTNPHGNNWLSPLEGFMFPKFWVSGSVLNENDDDTRLQNAHSNLPHSLL